MFTGVRCWALVVVLGSVPASLGCAATPHARMDQGIEAMRRESAPAELAARGEAFATLGDMTRAEQYFVAALKAGGEPGALVRRLVAVCVADGRYPVALEYADDYLRNHPNDLDVRYVAATLRGALGDVSGAREGLRAVIARKPRLADAHYALAQIEKGEGDVMAADASFRQYLRLEPAGPHAEVARANLMQSVPE